MHKQKKCKSKMHIQGLPLQNTLIYTYCRLHIQPPASWNLLGSICAFSGRTSTLLMMCQAAGWRWCLLAISKKQVQRHSSLLFFCVDYICLDSLHLKSLQQPSILSRFMLPLSSIWRCSGAMACAYPNWLNKRRALGCCTVHWEKHGP